MVKKKLIKVDWRAQQSLINVFVSLYNFLKGQRNKVHRYFSKAGVWKSTGANYSYWGKEVCLSFCT